MKRLYEFEFGRENAKGYRPDILCRALTPPSFVPELPTGASLLVRFVVAPASAPEYVITLTRENDDWQVIFRTARISLWGFAYAGVHPQDVHRLLAERRIPPACWEATTTLPIDALPAELLNPCEFERIFEKTSIVRMGGTSVHACMVTSNQEIEIRNLGAVRWIDEVYALLDSVTDRIRKSLDNDMVERLFKWPYFES